MSAPFPSLPTTGIIAVDGPSGSGKSTFAAALVAQLGHRAVLVGTDEFATWDNPVAWWPEFVAGLLAPFEVGEDLRPDAVVARIGWQAQLEIGIDRVAPVILELVGEQLLHEPDATTLMAAHVEHHSPTLLRDAQQCRIELGSAVAAQRAEHVTGQAL